MPIRFDTATRPYVKTDQSGFISAFKSAFGGAPYFETYSDEEVEQQIWQPHFDSGLIILANESGRIVGFGCAMPLKKAPAEVRDFLVERMMAGELPHDFTVDTTWYMSELGVIDEYRERGLAYELVRHRLITVSHRGGRHYVMRTALEGSNSRHLYEQVGSHEVATRQDISTSDQVTKNLSHSTKRAYLYGRCDEAVNRITQRLRDKFDQAPDNIAPSAPTIVEPDTP